ncbi:MAG: chorismate synthase [archaeon]|nr:chorismate synthase [archaeon]
MQNTMGTYFSITSFGESHGSVIGIIIDGCPSGLKIDTHMIQRELNRRRPGQSKISTSRNEKDEVKIITGLRNDVSTGAPICMIIENKDKDSSKYDEVYVKPRPSHADYPAIKRFGKSVDLRGSGRFSGRNTAGFVMAGSIAKMLLSEIGINIAAYTKSINNIIDNNSYSIAQLKKSTEKNSVRTVDSSLAEKMEIKVVETEKKKDSVGGIIACIIEGCPPGIGDPMFNSLESKISSAVFSVPAVKGIEFGIGFKATEMNGSQHNDSYEIKNKKIITKSNNSGGIIGGISTGMPITFNVAIKPTASIGIEQETVDLLKMENTTIKIEGRHDPCIVPRAVPVIEAITAVTLVDMMIGLGKIPNVLREKSN